MKTSQAFRNTIQSYLDASAATDELFATSFAKEGKTIDDCITYILNTVQKSGCNGFIDDEIFGMAVHYYDEDQIEVGAAVNTRVVVNHTVELTADEINDARKAAKDKIIADELARLQKKQEPKKTEPKTETASIQQGSLF